MPSPNSNQYSKIPKLICDFPNIFSRLSSLKIRRNSHLSSLNSRHSSSSLNSHPSSLSLSLSFVAPGSSLSAQLLASRIVTGAARYCLLLSALLDALDSKIEGFV
uniref:Uncharacterized protein n=1 Tax=Solanum tuberosum TaxID=4113 RepID=M1DKW6_SOLTU